MIKNNYQNGARKNGRKNSKHYENLFPKTN